MRSGPLALTGATGLVGRAVLSAARRPVRALYRSRPGGSGAEWVRGDLSDERSLEALCEGAEVLVHAAGLTAARRPADFHAVNVVGAARMATAARRAGVRRLVLISSQAAREPHLSPYAMSKRLGETAFRRAAGDAEVCVIRPPAVFGPGDEATAPIMNAIRQGALPVPGGRNWRDRRFAAVTAEDLAGDILRVAASGGPGPVEPSSFRALSWTDLSEAAAAAGYPVRLVPLPPVLLRLAGSLADGFGRIAGKTSVFGRGKAEEMLHADWSADGGPIGEGSLAEALRPLLGSATRGRNEAGAERAAPIKERAARAVTGHSS